MLFAQRGGWFLSAQEMTKIHVAQTFVRLAVKPFEADGVFWEVVGHPELKDQPLSFHFFGAMTVGQLILEEPELDEAGGVDALARQMMIIADRKLSEIVATWSVDDFNKGLAGKTGRYFTARIAALLAAGRHDEARQLCEEAQAQGSNGGFWSSNGGTFNEMAARWIADHPSVENSPIAS